MMPAPEQPASVATSETVAEPAPARHGARSEERSVNLFARVKEFAFTRGTTERPIERHPPRLSDRGMRPVANAQPSLAGGMDEIGDIPSFLRREKVEG